MKARIFTAKGALVLMGEKVFSAVSDAEHAQLLAKLATAAEIVREILMADDGADAGDRLSAIVEHYIDSGLGFGNPYASEEEHPWLYPHDPGKGCPWCGDSNPGDEGTCGVCGRLV